MTSLPAITSDTDSSPSTEAGHTRGQPLAQDSGAAAQNRGCQTSISTQHISSSELPIGLPAVKEVSAHCKDELRKLKKMPSLVPIALLAESLPSGRETEIKLARVGVELQLQDQEVRGQALSLAQRLLRLSEEAIRSKFMLPGELADQHWLETIQRERFRLDPVQGLVPTLAEHVELLQRKLIVWRYFTKRAEGLGSSKLQHAPFRDRWYGKVAREALMKLSPGLLDLSTGNLPYVPLVPPPIEKGSGGRREGVGCPAEDAAIVSQAFRLERFSEKALNWLALREGNERYRALPSEWFSAKWTLSAPEECPHDRRTRLRDLLSRYGISYPVISFNSSSLDAMPDSALEGWPSSAEVPARSAAEPDFSIFDTPRSGESELENGWFKLQEEEFCRSEAKNLIYTNEPQFPKARVYSPVIEPDHEDIQKVFDTLGSLSQYFQLFSTYAEIRDVAAVNRSNCSDTDIAAAELVHEEKMSVPVTDVGSEATQVTAGAQNSQPFLDNIDYGQAALSNEQADDLYSPVERIMEGSFGNDQLEALIDSQSEAPTFYSERYAGSELLSIGSAEEGGITISWSPSAQLGAIKQRRALPVIEVLLDEQHSDDSSIDKICTLLEPAAANPESRQLRDFAKNPFFAALTQFGKIRRLHNVAFGQHQEKSVALLPLDLAAGAVLDKVYFMGAGTLVQIRGKNALFRKVAFCDSILDIDLSVSDWGGCVATDATTVRGNFGDALFDRTSRMRWDVSRADCRMSHFQEGLGPEDVEGMILDQRRFPPNVTEKWGATKLSWLDREGLRTSQSALLGKKRFLALGAKLAEQAGAKCNPLNGTRRASESSLPQRNLNGLYLPFDGLPLLLQAKKGDITGKQSTSALVVIAEEPKAKQPCVIWLAVRESGTTNTQWTPLTERGLHYHDALFKLIDILSSGNIMVPVAFSSNSTAHQRRPQDDIWLVRIERPRDELAAY